jgi:3-methylcrotonyl-CoA carboxylase beta subunit
MRALNTAVNRDSEEFLQNRSSYEQLSADLQKHLALSQAGGPADAVALQKERGKLTARERIAALLDPDSPWLELSPLAAFGLYDNRGALRRDHHRHRFRVRSVLRHYGQ